MQQTQEKQQHAAQKLNAERADGLSGNLNGGLANGSLRYLSTILHDCRYFVMKVPLERGPKRPQKFTRKGNVQANVRANNSEQCGGTTHENVGFRDKKRQKVHPNSATILSAPLIKSLSPHLRAPIETFLILRVALSGVALSDDQRKLQQALPVAPVGQRTPPTRRYLHMLNFSQTREG